MLREVAETKDRVDSIIKVDRIMNEIVFLINISE